jgi:hypothetical protein
MQIFTPLNPEELEALIVDTLHKIGLFHESAVDLLLGTCAQESHMGKYRKQIKGPALGIMQIEPATFEDVTGRYLGFKKELRNNVLSACGIAEFKSSDLKYNDILSICVARIKFYMDSEPIPYSIVEQAIYYKRVYNTSQGAATPEQYIKNFHRFILKTL